MLEARLRALAGEQRPRPGRDRAEEALLLLVELPRRPRRDAQHPQDLVAEPQRRRVHCARSLRLRRLDDRSLIDRSRGDALRRRSFGRHVETRGRPHHHARVLGDDQGCGIGGEGPLHRQLREGARGSVQ